LLIKGLSASDSPFLIYSLPYSFELIRFLDVYKISDGRYLYIFINTVLLI